VGALRTGEDACLHRLQGEWGLGAEDFDPLVTKEVYADSTMVSAAPIAARGVGPNQRQEDATAR
jgi:hypothetical protein